MNNALTTDYQAWLNQLKANISAAQQRSVLAVNQELIKLYWQIGNGILKRQHEQGLGTKVVDQLAQDLRHEFPQMKGLSRTNLLYMRAFAEAWPDFPHNLQSELAQQTLKDPYVFDFLNLGTEARERDIEQALTQHISQFLLELGAGFAFVGKQVLLEVGEQDFYIDLLFYHLKLRCYLVIELKTGDFKPEHIGQLSFYLSAVDAQLKTEQDAPTIGLLLCKNRNKLVAEYALRDNSKPIGIAEYQFAQALPKNLEEQLPSIERIEQALLKDLSDENND